MPHLLSGWNPHDAYALAAFLRQHARGTELPQFLADVQAEFATLYGYFNDGQTPQAELTQLLSRAAQEVADQTTQLVQAVNETLQDAAARGVPLRGRAGP